MKAFRCSRTGVLFPADYVENWGIKYGRGLGPVPVSEALINRYRSDPARGKDGRFSHPVAACRAQVDLVEVTEEEYAVNAAVLHQDDLDYKKRHEIMRDKQLVKEGSKLSMITEHEVPLAQARIEARRANAIAPFAKKTTTVKEPVK